MGAGGRGVQEPDHQGGEGMKGGTHPFIPRWSATITYRTEAASLEVVHHLEEITDLGDLIERGPNSDAIIEVRIVRFDPCDPDAVKPAGHV
jgi:hypothetical protein